MGEFGKGGFEPDQEAEKQPEPETASQDNKEYIDSWLAKYADEEGPKPELRDCEREAGEFLTLVRGFEAAYPLNELHAITELTADDAPNHPLRAPAKLALYPIVKLLKAIKEETNISPERALELDAEYKKLTVAVGFIGQGRVRHE